MRSTGTNRTDSPRTPAEALQRLVDGNRRFASAAAVHPDQCPTRRAMVARAQHPVAVVLGCSDSRVPPEVVFDQGLGDLFVIRVAGHVVDDVTLGSIEYAVEQLGVRLVLVLGHEGCGAVQATLDGGSPPGHIGRLTDAIRPAVGAVSPRTGDPLTDAIAANVEYVVRQLRSAEPLLAPLSRDGALVIVGGCYAMKSGVVKLLSKPSA